MTKIVRIRANNGNSVGLEEKLYITHVFDKQKLNILILRNYNESSLKKSSLAGRHLIFNILCLKKG